MWTLENRVIVVSLPLCFFKTRTLHYVEVCVTQELIVIIHFYLGYMYVMCCFAIVTSVMMPRGDPGETKRP
jgi:hypothetical protein